MIKVIITEKDGIKKFIGSYDEVNKVFTSTRDVKKHLLRKYNAWSLDKKLVVELLVPNKALIRIVDLQGNKYEIDAIKFLELSKDLEFHQHREQLYLSLNNFNIIRRGD